MRLRHLTGSSIQPERAGAGWVLVLRAYSKAILQVMLVSNKKNGNFTGYVCNCDLQPRVAV